MTPLARAPRGPGSAFSKIIRAGRSDKKNRRSASWTASFRSWVTNSVVAFTRVVSAEELGPQPRRDRLIERHEGLVEQEKIRTNRKGPGDCRPSCKPERQFSRVSGEMRAETKYLDELPEIDFHLIGGKREANVLLDGAPR